MNDYNNNYGYMNYANNKHNRKQNSVAVAVVIALILVMGLAATGIMLYTIMDNRFDELTRRLEESESALSDYRLRLDTLTGDIYDIFGISDEIANELNADMNALRASIERVSSSPLFADTNNSRSINISDTVSRTAPSIIGVRVHVPSQNINNFWRTRAMLSEGSGIILTADGYIVTNYHVISLANRHDNAVLTVVLSDGSEHTASVVGGDEPNDLAVIKIEADNLPYAILGTSDDMQVGDFVIAIGNPLGMYLSGSVTFGIVSGVNRTINAENVAENLLQTDAAINPGNSGGALLNLHGEVIGINTLRVAQSRSGVNVEGIGFAIPIDHAKPIIDAIIRGQINSTQ